MSTENPGRTPARLFSKRWFGESMRAVVPPGSLRKWSGRRLSSLVLALIACWLSAAFYQQLAVTAHAPVAITGPADAAATGGSGTLQPGSESGAQRRSADTGRPEQRLTVRTVPSSAAAWNPAAPPIFRKGPGFSPLWWSAALVPVFLLLYVYERRKKLAALETERDPQVLTGFFREFEAQIRSIATPRKMKRFTNKLRLQYEHFKNLGLLGEGPELVEESRFLFICLYLLETRPELLRLDEPGFLGQVPGELITGFGLFTSTSSGREVLLEHIYRFNREAII